MPDDSLWWLLFVIINFLDLLLLSSSSQEDFRTVSLRGFLPPVIGSARVDDPDDRGGGVLGGKLFVSLLFSSLPSICLEGGERGAISFRRLSYPLLR